MGEKHDVTAILLAGGLSRRMGGGDKSLLSIGGVPLLQHSINRVRPQVSRLVLNANGDISRFNNFGVCVIPDVIDGNLGPLVGVLSGMEWSQQNYPRTEWIASLPTDAPFLPKDMVPRFLSQVLLDKSDIACAVSNERVHPPFAIWNIKLIKNLKYAIIHEGIRKIDDWTKRFSVSHIEFDSKQFDPFFNINNPENLQQAEKIFQVFFNE